MATERTPRESETREEEQFRQDDSWNPASILPTPKPQDGWVFRWIRTSILGQSDNTNVSRSMREGWIPVKAEDHPELEIQSDFNSRFQGNVEVGGLLLCKAPEEKIRSRTEHFQRVSANQMESVDNNFMRENDPRMPLSAPERNTRTTFGRS
jgi:hypothetical protein|tara:strand:+ start:4380 stop:4835 length:456 start_codon:yes stop_codon:yes gene_type:complete